MTIISTNEAPAAIGPYSQAVAQGDLLFCSGQISLTPEGDGPIGADAREQTEQIMKNIAAVLAAGGSSFGKVLKTTIFLVDMNDFAKVNEVYGRHFPEQPPARSTVAVSALPKGARVEIEVIASR
jgi:2-iminobutanoate/2-iminopropanoate deaminase